MSNTVPDPLKLAVAVSNACMGYAGDDMDVDGTDGEPTLQPDGSASFELTQFVTDPMPSRRSSRGPGGGKPLGIMRYTVTVVGKFEPFDD